MKKVLFALCLILPMLFSCSDDDEQYVSFEQSELEVDFKGGSFIVNVSANCNWDFGLRANLSWINEKKINENQIELYIQENDTYEDRGYSVTIFSEDGNSSAELNIVQKENKGIIGDNSVGEFDGESQNITVDIKTNIENPSIEMPDWITVASKGRALSNKSYVFTLSKNDTGEKRNGIIVFSGEGKSWKYIVRQKPIQVLPSKITFKEGENVLLSNNSDFTLTPVFTPVECTEKDLEWISSNTNVVTVSNGVLKVIGNGNSTVKASSTNGVSASINITVKIKLNEIIPISEDGYNMYSANWAFGYKGRLNFKVIPENSYFDIMYISSDPDIVSVKDGYLIANSSKEGLSKITIKDSYSGKSTFVNIKVARCFFYAGNTGFKDTVYGKMISFGGGIYSNNPEDRFDVVGVAVVKDGNIVADANYIGDPSNKVTFRTSEINVTEMFGMITWDFQKLSELDFLIRYKYNGSNEVYWEYIDIEAGTRVKI